MACWDNVWLASTLALPGLSQLRGLYMVPYLIVGQSRAARRRSLHIGDHGMRTGWVLTVGEKKNFEFTKQKSHAKWANYQLRQVKAMLENMIAKHFFFYFHAAAEIIYCCCCCSLFTALQFWHSHVTRPWFVCGSFCFVDLSHYWGEAARELTYPNVWYTLDFYG